MKISKWLQNIEAYSDGRPSSHVVSMVHPHSKYLVSMSPRRALHLGQVDTKREFSTVWVLMTSCLIDSDNCTAFEAETVASMP
jgi:hypothetical protein